MHMPGSRASRASSHLELVPAACPDRRTGGHRRKLSPAARRHRHRRVPRGNLTVQCSTHGGTGCPLALAAQVVRDSLTPLTLSWCTTLLSSSREVFPRVSPRPFRSHLWDAGMSMFAHPPPESEPSPEIQIRGLPIHMSRTGVTHVQVLHAPLLAHLQIRGRTRICILFPG